jgi:hypothetical protein
MVGEWSQCSVTAQPGGAGLLGSRLEGDLELLFLPTILRVFAEPAETAGPECVFL